MKLILKATVMFMILSQFAFAKDIKSTEKTSTTNAEKTKDTNGPLTAKDSLSEISIEKLEAPLNSIDYPEFQIVPRATERLAMEARVEKDLKYLNYWTFFASGFSSLMTGYTLSTKYNSEYDLVGHETDLDNKKNIAQFAQLAGLTWMGISYALAEQSLYTSAYTTIRKGKAPDRKTELLQERLADEAMERYYHVHKTLTYAAVTTNFIAGAASLSASNYVSKPYALITIVTSFLPLIFPHRYIETYEKQIEYKRKIYAPLVFMNYKYDGNKEGWTPLLTFNWKY